MILFENSVASNTAILMRSPRYILLLYLLKTFCRLVDSNVQISYFFSDFAKSKHTQGNEREVKVYIFNTYLFMLF